MKIKRKLQRKSVVSTIEVYSKDNRKNLGKGFVVDLNENGLKMLTDSAFDIGEEYALRFDLPNGWRLDFFGKIIYENAGLSANAYGVKFSEGQETFVLRLM